MIQLINCVDLSMIGLKQIFTWWNKKTFGTFLKLYFLENM